MSWFEDNMKISRNPFLTYKYFNTATRPQPKDSLEAYLNIFPDSNRQTIIHPHFIPKIISHSSPEPSREYFTPPKDRAFFADPEKKALFSAVSKVVQLTESIGTLLEGVQLSQLDGKQLDELAALVNERGVVFFRGQDLTTEKQVELFEHYGILDKHPAQQNQRHVIIKGSNADWREISNYTPWPNAEFHADTSFEINQWSNIPKWGDTAWVSQYGLYDALSDHYKRFLDGLHAVHTSRLQCTSSLFSLPKPPQPLTPLSQMTLDCWGGKPNRAPIDTHHPAVRTHPVTGLKTLNVNAGFVTGFAELKKEESDHLLQFLRFHIHSADDHYVRWKWEVGSVAFWDNRVSIHRVIPGNYAPNSRTGVRTTVFGEKPYLDPNSESRQQRVERLAKEKLETEIPIENVKLIEAVEVIGKVIDVNNVKAEGTDKKEKPVSGELGVNETAA